MALTREDIFALCDRPPKVAKVVVPDVGEFFVRVMTGRDRDAFESESMRVERDGKELKVKRDMTNMRARLVVRCLSDEAGKRLFTDADAPKLGGMAAPVLDVLFDACQRINKLSDEAVEEARKNLPKEPESDSSGSSSQAT